MSQSSGIEPCHRHGRVMQALYHQSMHTKPDLGSSFCQGYQRLIALILYTIYCLRVPGGERPAEESILPIDLCLAGRADRDAKVAQETGLDVKDLHDQYPSRRDL